MQEQGLVERMCAYNRALGEPTRMKMVKILGSHPPNTLNVSDIAGILGISQPTATKHLKIMEGVGAFERTRVGSNVYYSLRDDAINEYRQLLDDAFAHAYTACAYGYDCRSCPHAATCN